jgi:hypothetical protein
VTALGALLKEYRPAAGAARKLVGIALGSACIAALFFSGAVSEVNSGSWGGGVGLSVIALLFSSPVAVAGYVLFQGRGARLAVHEQGFAFHRGSKDSTVLWADIESFILASAIRVVTKQGEVIELGGGLEGIDEVAQTMSDRTLELMLPRLEALLAGGASAEFKVWQPGGKLLANALGAGSGFTVDAVGITEKDSGRRMLWSAVTGYELAQGALGRSEVPVRVFRIADPTQSFVTRADLLSNTHVLLALCEKLTSPREG